MNTKLHQKRTYQRRANDLPRGYAKTISDKVEKKHGQTCTPRMVYWSITNPGVNPYIDLEIALMRREIQTIKKQIKELQFTACLA